MLTKLTTAWQNFEAKARQDWKIIWDSGKGFFFAAGILILIVKFRDIIIDILLNSAKRLFSNATKKDAVLDNQETKDNNAANALVDQANKLPSNETPTSDDWNKK